ncbi:MAG: PDZ domain-containing protein [Anaerolineae bacterium]|nr:PDZ domain-containing protein [Anaerolineae bacterium]
MRRQLMKYSLPVLVLYLAILVLSTPTLAQPHSLQTATLPPTFTPTPAGAGSVDVPPTATQSALTFIRLGFTADVTIDGLRITRVYAGGAAQVVGLQTGDVVIGADNILVSPGATTGKLVDYLLTVTTTTQLAVQRGSQSVIKVTLIVNPPTPTRTPFRTPTPNPARGRLGIAYEMVTEATAKQRNLTVTEGAYVIEVGRNTPAEQAGIVAGDVIVEVAGDKVDARHSLSLLLSPYIAGDEFTLTLVNGSSTRMVTVILARSTGPVPTITRIPSRQVA